MEKDKKIKNETVEVVSKDANGNVIPAAFPVSARTKKDQSKTSVIYTLIAVLLHILAFVPIIVVPIVLAVKCSQLAPYYSFWPFVGLIVAIVFAIIYAIVVLCVTRKKSKSNIGMQTVKVAITFTCLTSVFALILTYAVPDIIAMATQHTLLVEDIYYNADSQAEKNIKLDRDFIMYNVLNGNLNNYQDAEHGDYSYATLSKRNEDSFGKHAGYLNEEIEKNYQEYMSYGEASVLQSKVIDVMKVEQPRKYELYDFVYTSYVLPDFDYALYNTIERRAFTLAIVDYVYTHANYEQLLKEGFSNKKIKQIFDSNFDNFNHDGYQTFDDPLLLYAQLGGRLTTSVIIHVILNDGWTYSQGALDTNGNWQYTEDGNLLLEQYNPEARDKFVAEYGEDGFKFKGTLLGIDGNEYEEAYGFNSDGWMIFKNGVVKRPVKWCVLDMDGNAMSIASLDLFSMIGADFEGVINGILPSLSKLIDSVGGLLQEDLAQIIQFATGGANINLNIYFDDDSNLNISLVPMNKYYGFSGYMNTSWVQSNNLLLAVINVVGLRNWFSIFGAVGIVLVIAAGVMRECAKKTRLRTAVSRDRIMRSNTAKRIADGEYDPTKDDEHSQLVSDLTLNDVEAIEKAQSGKDISAEQKIAELKSEEKKEETVEVKPEVTPAPASTEDTAEEKQEEPTEIAQETEKTEEQATETEKTEESTADVVSEPATETESTADVVTPETDTSTEPNAENAVETEESNENDAESSDDKKKKKKKDKKKDDDGLENLDLDDLDDLSDLDGVDLSLDDSLDNKSKKKKSK